jgi:hypothetical protein
MESNLGCFKTTMGSLQISTVQPTWGSKGKVQSDTSKIQKLGPSFPEHSPFEGLLQQFYIQRSVEQVDLGQIAPYPKYQVGGWTFV